MKENLPIKNERVLQVLSKLELGLVKLLGDNLVKIILFGSYVREQQDSESDLDIMILVRTESEITKACSEEINETVFQLSLKYDLILSTMVKEEQKFSEYSIYVPFYTNISREGVAIFPDSHHFLTIRSET